MPSWFVILMGLSTVFIGLICIILLCQILSAVCAVTEKKKDENESVSPKENLSAPTPSFSNRQEVIAAISAVIAEENGVDANGIRIVSIKKL